LPSVDGEISWMNQDKSWATVSSCFSSHLSFFTWQKRHLCWIVFVLHLNLHGFLLHFEYTWFTLVPTSLTTDSVPILSYNFAQVNRFLSVLLNANYLFPTRGICTCCFLCLECSSFCFSHDWVFLIFYILTEMSLPQQSLSWPC
jgi:hypothetical protein